MSAAPALAVDHLSVRYDRGPAVLRDVSFTAERGEVIAVVGRNGAGKSSLFKAIMGLTAHEGEVGMHGQHCHHRSHRLPAAFVPQRTDVDLAFPIDVLDVVLAGRRPFVSAWGRPSAADRADAGAALARVGLAEMGERRIGALSGGELQRVLIARAIAQRADILLLDEALNGVDPPSTEALLDLLDALAGEGATVLLSTHDLSRVRRRFGRCLAVNGALVGDGAPADVLTEVGLDAAFGAAPPVVPSGRAELVS